VVNDSRYDSLRSEVVPEVYLCTLQQPPPNAHFIYVRTESNPDGVLREIRSAVQELGPGLPLFNVKTIERQVDESLVTERMITAFSIIFGMLATILAVVGLYGVTAYAVTRRSTGKWCLIYIVMAASPEPTWAARRWAGSWATSRPAGSIAWWSIR
jgi:hypothetical protein